MKKYAVKVPLAVDDYIYVTESNPNCFDLKPILYNKKQEAEKAASIWGPLAKVVEYKEDHNES